MTFFFAAVAALIAIPIGFFVGGYCGLHGGARPSASGGSELAMGMLMGAVCALLFPIVTFAVIMNNT